MNCGIAASRSGLNRTNDDHSATHIDKEPRRRPVSPWQPLPLLSVGRGEVIRMSRKRSTPPLRRNRPTKVASREMTKIRGILFDVMSTPVSADEFDFAVEIFHMAALGQMPNSAIPPPPEGSSGFAFTDIPFNRGMLAVCREFMHLDDQKKQSLILRLMVYGDVIGDAKKDGRFAAHVIENEDVQLVSKLFQNSYAVCPLIRRRDRTTVDMGTLESIMLGAS